MEASSFVRLAEKETYINKGFKEIKMRNEKLKADAYAKYMQMKPPNQSRLMSAFDIKEGKMQVSFL